MKCKWPDGLTIGMWVWGMVAALVAAFLFATLATAALGYRINAYAYQVVTENSNVCVALFSVSGVIWAWFFQVHQQRKSRARFRSPRRPL